MTLLQPSVPRGVIEGFYGQVWPFERRKALAPFLKDHGFGFYIYAPKADPYLRKDWRTPLPDPHFEQLHHLAHAYEGANVQFGIGLSPFGYGRGDELAMLEKIDQINRIDPEILCILFDDMPGGRAALAQEQIDLVHLIEDCSIARQILVCPTYYSTSPVLEQIFGPMPKGYLQELGRHIPENMEIFWTGEKVISPALPLDHLEEITVLLQRRPFIWDNAFSNDAATTSRFLKPLVDWPRTETLAGHIAGHAFNGMNQSALFTLSLMHIKDGMDLHAAVKALVLPGTASLVTETLLEIADQPLDGISQETREKLIAGLQGNDPMVRDLRDWLNGVFRFDPACLTH